MRGGAVAFACRFAVGAVRLSFPFIGLCRLIAFPSRCYCPRVGSSRPSSSGLSGIVLASSRRHTVGGEGVVSSPLAPLVRYGERGAVCACGV